MSLFEVALGKPKTLEVTISDTGRRIEPNRLEQVFDCFYQEEGALRRSAGGTGLGLAICRQIVNGWGGEIWAESQAKITAVSFILLFQYLKIKLTIIPQIPLRKNHPVVPASKRK
jgi:signal transduction histidine kinase